MSQLSFSGRYCGEIAYVKSPLPIDNPGVSKDQTERLTVDPVPDDHADEYGDRDSDRDKNRPFDRRDSPHTADNH